MRKAQIRLVNFLGFNCLQKKRNRREKPKATPDIIVEPLTRPNWIVQADAIDPTYVSVYISQPFIEKIVRGN